MAVTPNANIIYREEKGPLGQEAYNLTPQEVDGNFRLLWDKLTALFQPIALNQYGTHPAFNTLPDVLAYLLGQSTTPANSPPTVSLAANDTTITTNETLVLTATPADADGTIAKVEFYEGAVLLATKTAAPWTHSIPNPTAASHAYTAKAFDNLNAVTTSNQVTVTVTTPPDLGVAYVSFWWGQSNDSGLSDRAGLSTATHNRVKTWNDFTNAIETYQLGVNDNSINSKQWNGAYIVPDYPPSFGPDYGYAQEFIKDTSRSAETHYIFKPWVGVLPNETVDTNSATTTYWKNTLYPKVLTQWNAFKAALLAAGHTSVVVQRVFSGLGEGNHDAGLQSIYKADMLTLFGWMLNDGIIQAGTQKFLMAKQPAQYADIRTLQQQIVTENTGYTLLTLETPTFATDGVHYSQEAMLRLGILQYNLLDVDNLISGFSFVTMPPITNLVELSDNVYGTTSTNGSWGNGGLLNLKLPAGVEGGIAFRYPSTDFNAAFLGFKTYNSWEGGISGPQSTWPFGVYISAPNVVQLTGPSAANVGIDDNNDQDLFYVVYRIGVEVWIHTIPFASLPILVDSQRWKLGDFPGDLFFLMDIAGSPTVHLEHPQGINLVTV